MATQYQRLPVDYLFGTLATAAAVSDTTISSAAFTSLGTSYSNTGSLVLYTPIVLHNPSLGQREVVWVVGHTAGSQQVTVLRGQEGTTAQAWPSNTQVLCAPTAARDALGLLASTALPSNAHLGYRNAETDLGATVEMTSAAGWQPSVGVANAADAGPNRSSGNPPNGSAILMRGGIYTGSTNTSGQITIPFRTPFPNACICGVITAATSQLGPFSMVSESATGLTMQVWTMTALNSATAIGSGVTCSFAYLAIGY